MRDIKFRLYNPERKVLTAGHELNSILLTTDAEFVSDFNKHGMTWLQFTGKKDIDGLEIYENDILLIEAAITGSEGLAPGFFFDQLRVRVVWDEDMAIWSFNMDGDYSSYYDENDGRAKATFRNQVRAMMFDGETAKIVGNFNLNPELLKNETKQG